MRSLWMIIFFGVMFFVVPSVGAAKAQMQTSQSPTLPRRTPISPIDGPEGDPGDPMKAIREAQRVRNLANERQKRIVDDTAKLLQLAQELKVDVDKTTKDEMSLEVVRKAEEIEKLAHDVKQRMKG